MTSPTTQQNGIIRTNCVDCLDRTNVVQSNISKHMMSNYFKSKEMRVNEQFEFIMNNMWADNADAISYCYSGTGALKTDYTRMGIRTKMGAVQDGQRSIVRYIKNNFLDGSRQDGYELVLQVPFTKINIPSRPFTQVVMLLILSVLVQLIIGTGSVFSFVVTNMLIGSGVIMSTIAFNGKKMVDLPKLQK